MYVRGAFLERRRHVESWTSEEGNHLRREDHRYHGHSLYSSILDYLFYHKVSGANVVRGMAGFGADHHMHSTRILRLTENLPIKIEFIESSEKVEEILPKLHEMAGTGLIEVQDTTVVKAAELAKKEEFRGEQQYSLKRESKAKLIAHLRW